MSSWAQLDRLLATNRPTVWRAYKFMESLRADKRNKEVRKKIVDLIWNEYLTQEEREAIGTVHDAFKREGRDGYKHSTKV